MLTYADHSGWTGRGGDCPGLGNAASGWFERAMQETIAEDEKAAEKVREECKEEPPVVQPHDLRHTAASLAISAGANVKAVQRMLGHASAAMTLDTYADLFDDDLDDVATALDAARRSAGVVNLLPQVDSQHEKTPAIPVFPRDRGGSVWRRRGDLNPRSGLSPTLH